MTLLTGCFVVPSTRKTLTNGKPRPEKFIGDGQSNAIQIGKTTIADALIKIAEETRGSTPAATAFAFGAMLPTRDPADWTMWTLSPTTREIGIYYKLRTGTLVNVLCFQAQPAGSTRILRLTFDGNGVVTRSQTFETSDREVRDFRGLQEHPLDAVEMFSSDARGRLNAAGLLPSDEDLRRLRKQRDERELRMGRMPATSASRVDAATESP